MNPFWSLKTHRLPSRYYTCRGSPFQGLRARPEFARLPRHNLANFLGLSCHRYPGRLSGCAGSFPRVLKFTSLAPANTWQPAALDMSRPLQIPIRLWKQATLGTGVSEKTRCSCSGMNSHQLTITIQRYSILLAIPCNPSLILVNLKGLSAKDDAKKLINWTRHLEPFRKDFLPHFCSDCPGKAISHLVELTCL